MKTGKKGIELIKKWEGFRADAYIPVPGDVQTIGYGHTLNVKTGDKITQAEGEQFLKDDLMRFEECVNECAPQDLTQNQFDACISLAFNVGNANFQRSTLLKKLNTGDYAGAANQFRRWNRAGGRVLDGLTNRRRAERILFLS